MENFSQYFKGMDEKELKSKMSKADEFSKTEKGKALMEQLEKTNPQNIEELIKIVSKNPELIKTLKSYFE